MLYQYLGIYIYINISVDLGSQDSWLIRAPESWWKGCKFKSRQELWENFFSGANFVCWLLFGVCSIPVLPRWHVKDPCHSAKSAGGRLQLNTHTPLTQQSGSGLTMPLSGCSVGTSQEMSSHATCQGTLSYRHHFSLLTHCRQILT